MIVFERTRQDHGENRQEKLLRSVVVSGSGKFIFAVSARYLFGVYCNCLRPILPRAIAYLSQGHQTPSQNCCAGIK